MAVTIVHKAIAVPELKGLQPDDWNKGAQFKCVEFTKGSWLT